MIAGKRWINWIVLLQALIARARSGRFMPNEPFTITLGHPRRHPRAGSGRASTSRWASAGS